jgi:GDP-L-fucose synthase
MKHYAAPSFLNVGTGIDVTISGFAKSVSDVVGFKGEIIFDTSRPDGPPQKLLEGSKIDRLGWSSKISLRDGLAVTYADFQRHNGVRL